MTTTTLTPEQMQAGVQMLIGLTQELAAMGARLKDTHDNGYTIVTEVRKRGLPLVTKSAMDVVNSILFDKRLEWEPGYEPAKLKGQKPNTAIRNLNDAMKDRTFTDKVKAGEKADAQTKANEESIKQAKSLIAGYLPVKNTPRGQVVDCADQTLAQKEWTKALNQTIEKKRNLQEWVKALAATIQKRYRDREKANEHL